MFTVPSGGDGLYYFSTYLLIEAAEVAYFNIVVNNVIICTAWGDQSAGLDNPQATCSAVVYVTEGKNNLNVPALTFVISQHPTISNAIELEFD